MHKKLNCWEYTKCGREPGGQNIEKFGECPVPTSLDSNGINHGIGAGRICWSVKGTFCTQCLDAGFYTEEKNCFNCNFFMKVRKEEEPKFTMIKPIKHT